jgi:hypothetical protein
MLSQNYVLKIALKAFVLATALLTTSCAGSLYNVKPVVELPPLAADVKGVSAGGVTVRVAPLMSDEESQEPAFKRNFAVAAGACFRERCACRN